MLDPIYTTDGTKLPEFIIPKLESSVIRLSAAEAKPTAFTLNWQGQIAAQMLADGTATFDWPLVERVATEPAPYGGETAQIIARMLLAARDERPVPDRFYSQYIDACNWQRIHIEPTDGGLYRVWLERAGALASSLDIGAATGVTRDFLTDNPRSMDARKVRRLMAEYGA